QGVAVRSTRMGEGNIGMEDYLHKWKFTIRYFATKTTQRNSHAIDNQQSEISNFRLRACPHLRRRACHRGASALLRQTDRRHRAAARYENRDYGVGDDVRQ